MSLPYLAHTDVPQTESATTADNLHTLEAMSPSAMAFLLEVISADIDKTEDANGCQQNSESNTKVPLEELPVEVAQRSSKIAAANDHQSLTLPTPASVKTTTMQPAFVYSPISDTAENTVNVANNQEHLPTDNDLNANVLNLQPYSTKGKAKSQAKRMIDDGAETQSLRKKCRNDVGLRDDDCSLSVRQTSSHSTTPPKATQSELVTTTDLPTIQSTKNADSETSKTKKSRSRRFKEDELVFLDAVYRTDPYPDPMITERLSIQLEVPEHRIKVWFANRRHRQTRDRDQKTTKIMDKKDQLVTETAALPAESSNASLAFPSSPSSTYPISSSPSLAYPNSPLSAISNSSTALSSSPTLPFHSSPSVMPHYGMVPSGYSYIHPSTIPSALTKHSPADFAVSAERRRRAQIASTIQSRFPYSSQALLQLANQTMLSRSGLDHQYPPLAYPMMPSGTLPTDICDLAMRPRRIPPGNIYYIEPPILPPLTAESTSYTDGISLSPAIDSPSPWHWMP